MTTTLGTPWTQNRASVTDGSVAIVHDYLTQRGGAERVVLALHDAFPEAPVYTSLFDPDGTYPEFGRLPIRTSVLDSVGVLRRHHRWALPALAPTFSSTEIAADCVLCSSSGWAHGVRTDGRKVVYCYTPAHWLYQADEYLDGRGGRAAKLAMGALGPALRRWDRRAASTADVYVTTSRHIARQIREVYGIEAEVLPPPCRLDPDGGSEAIDGLDPGFFLCVARLTPYKHIDAVLGAFDALPDETIVVVGTGPEAARLHQLAGRNACFLPAVTDGQLRWLYGHARAVIAASFEDFGLTPVEAAMFGTPCLALRYGGYLDTVVEGVTGLLFEKPTPAAIANAIGRLEAAPLDPHKIRGHAQRFGVDHFNGRLRALVAGDAARP